MSEEATCTVRTATRVCGKPAIYTEVSRATGAPLGECAEHAALHGSLFNTRHMIGHSSADPHLGDPVEIHRYGKTYIGEVVYVGKRGRVEAEFTYDNGAKRRVRV